MHAGTHGPWHVPEPLITFFWPLSEGRSGDRTLACIFADQNKMRKTPLAHADHRTAVHFLCDFVSCLGSRVWAEFQFREARQADGIVGSAN